MEIADRVTPPTVRPCQLFLMAALFLSACSDRIATEPYRPVSAQPQIVRLNATVITEPVGDDPDDPAIWIHPADPEQSIIVATNKVEKPRGAVVVFDLRGKILQTIAGLDRPNNVDIEQGVRLGDTSVDIAAVTEREARSIRIYRIDPRTRSLSEMAKLPVFAGEQDDFAAPMGISIYKRPDGAAFLILGRKSGPAEGYLWQYRLLPGPVLQLARKFGKFSRNGEIEAIVVDDGLGYVYYADEGAGIRKYAADPDSPAAGRELALFGLSGYQGDREGLAIYAQDGRSGYVVSTDQVANASRYLLYLREGSANDPHDHSRLVAILESSADDTDGIEVLSSPLLPIFQGGMMVAMNSVSKNFLFFPWPESLRRRRSS